MAKIKWIVDPPPTGRYRSFFRRCWPTGELRSNGNVAFQLECDDNYTPGRARGSEPHGEIRIKVADRRGHESGWTWRTLRKRAASLPEAKALADMFLADNPEVFVDDAAKEEDDRIKTDE